MFKHLKKKIETEQKLKYGFSLEDAVSTDDVNKQQSQDFQDSQPQQTSSTEPEISSQEPYTVNNSPDNNIPSPESENNQTIQEETSSTTTDQITSKESEAPVTPDELNNLKQENVKLKDQIDHLTRKLNDLTNEKRNDYIDEKLLKLVGESIIKETSSDLKQSNGTESGDKSNWPLPLSTNLPKEKKINGDQYKDELEKLRQKINELEGSLREKNKTIRLQQQRINDIRKSFQKGSVLDSKLFDIPGSQSESEISLPIAYNQNNRPENGFFNLSQDQHQLSQGDQLASINCPMNDISFQYLRSVVFKFVLTSDYEAQKHLVKAISMLLHFSESEEKQIRDNLEQKVSWFANLPLLGNGFKLTSHHNPSSGH